MPQYLYQVYNNQPQSVAATQEKLSQTAAGGWHIHTAGLTYAELYVLWEENDGPPLEYQFAIYNNQFPDAVQERLAKMSADGWHIHTAAPNYSEFYVLWERGGSALANRVASHLPEAEQDRQPEPPAQQAQADPAASILGARSAPPLPPG
jgi:hypothetical protein